MAEARFREMEVLLDAAVGECIPVMREHHITVEDRSLRQYQGRVDYLRWAYSFTKRWELPLHTAQVRVHVSFGEPEVEGVEGHVHLGTISERYRPEATPEFRETLDSRLKVRDISARGLQAIVMEQIAFGANSLGQAL
ncbi:MAG: hypothetical protein HYX47_10060 [Burkholderiales bacterium]|nr:hypothetical protein [Burkholderiales bacterium]